MDYVAFVMWFGLFSSSFNNETFIMCRYNDSRVDFAIISVYDMPT